jgi:hypothetical protein
MLAVNSNFKTKNDALAKWPVYVAEIFWNNGNSGADGTNDIYFTTCDVNEITDFAYPERWFPFLKADSIGSMSQTVDPINGVSSIGALDVTITDYNGMVSDIIKAADAAGHGLRRQRISIYQLYRGMSWADKVQMRTMQVSDLRLTRLNEYKLTAADVQRQMQKTIFNPYSTTLTTAITGTGAITPNAAVLDARNFIAVPSVTYGAVGFVKIDDEIMRWTAKTDASFTVGASDRGLFGTVAATHSNGATVSEVIVLNENPITLALKILESSGTASANGTWDVFPVRWGCNMDSTNDIDEEVILEVGKLLTGLADTAAAADGVQFEFVIAEGVEAKKFIEDSIFKILGCFGFVRGDGRYSIKAYNDLSNAAKENAVATLDRNAVVSWGDLSYNYNDLANQVWIEFDEVPKLSGKYIRNTIFIDSVSIKKWGEAKQLKYQAQGIVPTSVFASQLYQRFQRVLARYSRPPMQIPLTLLPKYHLLEIGDIVRVSLPIRDLFTGLSLDRAFEVISTQLKVSTGEVMVNCIAQPERASQWFGGVGDINSVTISPAAASIQTGATQQMVARAFDGSGGQVQIPAISWIASGNVTVDSSGLVTAGAAGSGTVFAVVGGAISNEATITVTATPSSNPVASVSVLPNSVQIKAGDTQRLTAIAYDVSGNQVNGVTFNWNSSNTGVATIPAGSAVSKLLTAVANGTSNITATETVSGIVSPVAVATVATPGTPTYTPPYLADSAYQIGTQITAHGPVGGPHVIPDGYNFDAGSYWYDGSVSLASGTTCTINYTVRIFSLGTITINGTIDGDNRNYDSWPTLSGTPPTYVAEDGLRGFVGKGGTGGRTVRHFGTPGADYDMRAGNGGVPLYQSEPSLNVIVTAESGGSYTAVSGLPTNLGGGPSGGKVVMVETTPSPGIYPAMGVYGGAGLLFMARGIYITTGNINLRGQYGSSGIYPDYTVCDRRHAPSGGGGGGSFVGLVECDVNGLPNMSINESRIMVSGGGCVTGIEPSSATRSFTAPQPGTSGCVITQVIG